MSATVAIAKDLQDISNAIDEALSHFDLGPIVHHKIVAVKPNDTWASDDDRTGVTQPDTLRAVLRYLKNYGPRELIVTGGSGAGETDEIFKTAGLMDVVHEEGATFVDHNRPPFQSVELEYRPAADVAGPQKNVMVNPRVLEYEALIVLSQLKLHRTATATLALKNIAMSYPAADYYGHPRSKEKHENEFYEDMHSFIAAMAKRFPIDLAITAGHPAMIASGPLGGKAVETGIVIASTDAVAADVVGAKLLGFNVQAVRHLWEAKRLGLGETDTDEVSFPGMDLRTAIQDFTEAAYGKRMTYESV